MLTKNITTDYFTSYRKQLGFSNQLSAKSYLSAKDVMAAVNLQYIEDLNDRLRQIVQKLNMVLPADLRCDEASFTREFIQGPYEIILNNNILPKLNNQGRRPEQVYFSWMRGFVMANYFLPAMTKLFDIDHRSIELIGEDDLKNIETFKRTPTADLRVNLDEIGPIRIEVQSGFQGINDIKQHKVTEAKRVAQDRNEITIVLHFDIFNGQVAIVRLDNISSDNLNWITRQQMEGQTVFNIDQNYFVWKLNEQPPTKEELIGLLVNNAQ